MKNPINVIITDDKQKWRTALKKELSDNNITVIAEAENGLELLKHLKNFTPDIILLDLAMPVMDGNETMSYLNITYPEHKVIIMSQFDEPSLMNDYVMRNIKGCFSKSDAMGNVKGLVEAIRKVHGGGKYFDFATEEEILDFSIRQKEIINRYGKFKTQKEIAAELGITTDAVEKQKKKIMEIMGVKSLAEFYKFIFDRGLQFFRGPGRI